MKHLLSIISGAALFFISSCASPSALETVDNLETQRYLGTWYEIARLPNRFEGDLTCVTANYKLADNGNIIVTNRGYNTDKATWKEDVGRARKRKDAPNSQLRVSFFWPFEGDYYVVALGDDYEYAVVGDPSRKYFWILSRTPEISDRLYQDLLKLGKGLGFATENVFKTPQDCGHSD